MPAPLVTGLPFFLGPLDGPADRALEGTTVRLPDEEARHAAVRRIRSGERVAVSDGAGVVAIGVVAETGRSVLVRVEDHIRAPVPQPRLTVVQAIPKGERADRTVEVLTEIGVDAIVPWQAERCVAVWRGDRAQKSLARWRSTAREASKQARRAWLPEIAEPADLTGVLDLLTAADLAVVLHEAALQPMAALEVPTAGSIVVVVGPEGGITDEELTALTPYAQIVALGDTVLRTSTAGVAAAAALLTRTPRWA